MSNISKAKQAVAVVIPAFNEEVNLAQLTRQILDEPWTDDLTLDSLIIVDDCSADRTQEIAEGVARGNGQVHVIRHSQRSGKNAAMRTGLANCCADIVVFVDADVRLGLNCLTKTVQLLIDNPSLAGSSCTIMPLPPRSWRERPSRFQALLVGELRRSGHDSLARIYALKTAAVASLSLPDDIYDDLYIMRWLRNHGERYAVRTDATAYIRSAMGLRDFAKQTLRTWRAGQALETVLRERSPSLSSSRRGVMVHAVVRAVAREPLGFILYLAWRGIITVTPGAWWLPVVDHSRYDTSMSTKNLGV